MKKSLREHVKYDLIKQHEKDIGSGSWLNSALPFNRSLKLKTGYEVKLNSILEEFGISKRKENELNLEILIANLLRKGNTRPVMVSLNTTDWKKSRYTRTGESIIKLIHKLQDHDYIVLKKGFRTAKESRKARIWPTDKLLGYFPQYRNTVIYDPVEVVELRNDDKYLLDYKDTPRTRNIRSILTRANSVNQSADVKFRQHKLQASLIAVFIRKFTLYGRLHTKGNRHYQGLSSDERKEITINNDKVVELDYSGLHPHLLYANELIQFDEDPYSIVDNRPEARTFLKVILLCMINAKDRLSAEKAANHWLYMNHKERDELHSIGITSARPLMIKFMNVHKSIRHYFCSSNEMGLRIMNIDSRMALDIIDHFAERNIPILAIHDSFIVQEKYRDELLQVMDSAYQKCTNGFKCKIKQK